MTSAHGNKSLIVTACICLAAAGLLSGALIAEKKARIRLFEKKYTKVLSSLEAENTHITRDCKVPFIDETN